MLLVFLGCHHNSSGAGHQLTAQERRGRQVFETNCAICHNAYKNESLQGPPLVGVFKKHDLPDGLPATDEHVRETIKMGRRTMPPFNMILDDDQINDLLSYLHTL